MQDVLKAATLAAILTSNVTMMCAQAHEATGIPGVFIAHGVVPPEPDKEKSPRSHEGWRRALNADRDNTPKAHKMPVKHSPAMHTTRIENAIHNTLNWSGTAIIGGATAPYEAITTTFVVPTGQQAFGTCSPEAAWVALWAGIDGEADNDVLQGGVSISATCDHVDYEPWLEWYPADAVAFSSPVIHPGDLVFVEVWNTTPTQGWIMFYDYTTDVAAEYGVTASPGVSLTGSSVEWILERPGTYPHLPALTNYIASSWIEGSSWNWDVRGTPISVLQMGAQPDQGSLEQFIMLDDNGQPISSATILAPQFLFFENYGPSCGLGNGNATPC